MDTTIAVVIGDIALVFVIASLLGAAARKCGQPAVIGQILTGVLLGPSLLGRLPGHLTSRLFPSHALPYLNVPHRHPALVMPGRHLMQQARGTLGTGRLPGIVD
jgi:Kef-type K+ transport system membrane component KefB